MSSLTRQIFHVAGVEVDTLRGCLRRDGQEECYLREQALQVFLYLLEHPERPVTKEELMENVWQGTAVTDDALVQCIVEIRKALGDDSRRPHFIKTIPKVGYRFIGPVEGHEERELVAVETEEVTSFKVEFEEELSEQEIRVASAPAKPLTLPGAVTARPRRTALSAVIGLILLAGIVLPIYLRQKTLADRQELAEVTLPHVAGKRPVAVMYFENRSGTPELDWLREGLADMLITDLSRSAKLTVLNRQQLHRLLERMGHRQGETIQPMQALDISRRSRAESVILGSFARLGEKLRLDVQLYDARNGQLVASESLIVDRVEQILMQIDLLALKLATHLGDAPTELEKRPGLADVMTNNLEAYRSYSLALEKAQAFHNEEAIALLEKAVALDPQFALAHARIGYAYAVTGNDAEKARPHLEKAFQMSNRLNEKDSLYIIAWYSIANLDYPGAMGPLRKIIAQYPMEVEAYLRLGYLLRGEGQHEEAIRVLKQGLVIDPEARDIYNALGLIYLDLHRYDEAIAAHQRYVELSPAESNAHDSLGMSYQCAGRYDEAIAAYNHALALTPDYYVAQIHLGNAYVQLGRYQAALVQFRRVIQIAPNDFSRSRAYGSMAETFLRKGDLRQAAAAARLELQHDKYNVWNSFVVTAKQGNKAAMEKLRGRLLATWPYTHRGQNFPARLNYYWRGELALRNGQPTEAIENFREALLHPPLIWKIDPLEDCLAKAFLETDDLDEAISEYERILRLNQNYPLAHYHLAQAYERKGQQDQARAVYERFLRTWKDADADLPEIIVARNRLSE